MKKTVKILNIVILAMMILVCAASIVLATSPSDITVTDPTNATSLQSLAGKIIGIIRFIGTALSIGIIIVLGIKYMTSSPEGKADYKGTMIPYLVGAVLIFAGSWIATGIYEMINGLDATPAASTSK